MIDQEMRVSWLSPSSVSLVSLPYQAVSWVRLGLAVGKTRYLLTSCEP